MKRLEDYLKPTQKELFRQLCAAYKNSAVSCKGSYILVRGEAPVMLIAHLDTVHTCPVREICKSEDGNVLMSPQGIGGDDRCGVYALAAVYERSQVKPWLLFTCDEEAGGIGAHKFREMHGKGRLPKELDGLKLLIEIDRNGKNDAVYYDCCNPDLEDYITGKGFQTAWGSFSDISVIAPGLGVAAVNLSSGYYNAHTPHEYINRKHLDAVVQKVVEIVADAAGADFPKYEYIEIHRNLGYRKMDKFSGRQKPAAWAKPKATAHMTEKEVIAAVPKDIRDDYVLLLDYYTVDELEDLRAAYGDRTIPILCRTELGYSYGYHSGNDGYCGYK